MGKCSTHQTLPEDPQTSLFVDGELEFKAHQVGFIVCGGLSLIASITTAWLVSKHLAFYTKPLHQRHIVRLLFMVPVYAWVSFLSYFWWEQALYFQLIRDAYEAIVVGSFFYLIVAYLAETPAALGALFRNFEMDKWMWPLGKVRYRPSSGWHFYQICRFCVLQYVLIRPLSTLVSVITQAFGYYCLDSWSVLYYHVWNVIIISISVTVALYFLLQIFVSMHDELKPYQPVLKFLSVKAVVAIIFWQATLLAILEYFEVGIKATRHWTADQVAVGIDALLISAEMVIFAFMHIKAFSYLPYRPKGEPDERKQHQTKRWASLRHAFDFRDVFAEMFSSTKYVGKVARGKHRPPDDQKHLEQVFGKRRPDAVVEEDPEEKALLKRTPHPKDESFEERLQRARLLGADADKDHVQVDDDGVVLPDLDYKESFDDHDHPPLKWSDDMRRHISFGIVRYPSNPAALPHPNSEAHGLFRAPSSQFSHPSSRASQQRDETNTIVDKSEKLETQSDIERFHSQFPPPQFSPNGRIRPVSPQYRLADGQSADSSPNCASSSPYAPISSSFFRPSEEHSLPLGRMRLPRHDLPPQRQRIDQHSRRMSAPISVITQGGCSTPLTALVYPARCEARGPRHPDVRAATRNSLDGSTRASPFVFTEC